MKALRAKDLTNIVGVNTHVGNSAIAPVYTDPAHTIAGIDYLGVRLLRDMGADSRLRLVAAATGAKLVMAISETGADRYASELSDILGLGPQYIAALEGPNEPDDGYAISQGGSMKAAAAFQPTLFRAARAIGVPAIANSFESIWPDPGNYGSTGDLSRWADYGNAHIYFAPHECGPNGNGAPPHNGMIDWVRSAAMRTVPGKPVAVTEFGWTANHNLPATIAAYATTALLSLHYVWGAPFALWYGMFNDMAGQWGLFNDDGTPRPVATAIRNLLRLFNDPASNAESFTPTPFGVGLGALPTGENPNAGGKAALYQFASGDYALALWNEQRLTTPDDATPPNVPIIVAPAPVTVSLPAAAQVDMFDPLISTMPVRSYGVVQSFGVQVPAHPIVLMIRPKP